MATQTISYLTGTNFGFTTAECVEDTITLNDNVLRTCILTITNPITNEVTYRLSTTISSITNVSGQYNGENLINVTATITDVSNNPVTVSWGGQTVILTWTSSTPDFGSICGYTVVTDQNTYVLDQPCYNFVDMTFSPNGFTEECNETQVTISAV